MSRTPRSLPFLAPLVAATLSISPLHAQEEPKLSPIEPPQSENSGFAIPFVVQGVAEIGGKWMVTIANRDTDERFMLKTGEEGPNGLRLVSVERKGQGDCKVQIRRGNEVATLQFDQAGKFEPLESSSKVKGGEAIQLNYPNANVQAVLLLYGTLIGRHVIFDSSVQGNLSIVIHEPVSRRQAINIIESALVLNNYSVVLHGEDSVHVLGPGKPTRSDAIPIYFDEKAIPEGTSIITFVFKLKHLNSNELSNILNQYLATGQPYTSFLPTPGSNGLMVTETTRTIRNLIPLIKTLDVPAAPEVQRLKEQIAELEKQLKEKQEQR